MIIAGARRRQPRGPVGLQRGGRGARDRRLADPDDLRRRPRDRLHDRRLRRRPARAHAVGGGRARGRRPRRSCRRASTRSTSGATRRCGCGSRACARASRRRAAHRVFAAERGPHPRPRAARRRAGAPRRGGPAARGSSARAAHARRLRERLEAFRWDRQLARAARANGAPATARLSALFRAATERRRGARSRGSRRARRPVAARRAGARLRARLGRARGRLVRDAAEVAPGDGSAHPAPPGRARAPPSTRGRTSDRDRRRPRFEPALQQLEQIVQKLEKGELPLEESLELYEDGIRLSRLCHGKLEEAEGRIEMLLKDARGEPSRDAAGRPQTQAVRRRATRTSGDDDGRAQRRPRAAVAALRGRDRGRARRGAAARERLARDDPPRGALQPVRRRQAHPPAAGARRGRGRGRRARRSSCRSPARWR